MALFDSGLLFYHTGNVYSFTAGEYVNLAGTTATSASSVINLGNARDLGIGPGAEIPRVEVGIGTAFTSSSSGLFVNLQFQGSTNSVLWNTYMETPATATTASFSAGATYHFDVPRRPPGVSLPLYYQLVVNLPGAVGPSLSTGTILAGIVLAGAESAAEMSQYPAGFTFPSGA